MRPLLLLLATLPLVAPADWYTLDEQADAITLIEGPQPLAENLLSAHTIDFVYGPETYRGVARPTPDRYREIRTNWLVDCADARVRIDARTVQNHPLGSPQHQPPSSHEHATETQTRALLAHACEQRRGLRWDTPEQARQAKWQTLMAATFPWMPAQTPAPAPAE